ncbi:MAG: hypothetical protein JWN72_92 [Thermoleophilia bacterium]|nr:hypothetical protein [Thermoleophilia bacterium]
MRGAHSQQRADKRSMYWAMRRPPRPSTPSAIDGYQRLRRGSSVAAPYAPDATPAGVLGPVELAGSGAGTGAVRTWRHRVVGATRLAGLVAVLAIIVGASVGLASSDSTHPRSNRERAATSSTAPEPVVPTADVVAAVAKPATSAKAAPATTSTVEPDVVAEAAIKAAPSATTVAERAASIRPDRVLPFTGDRTAPSLLLGGAALVLLGMLLQIAGQPLPAQRRASPAER